ncbi:ABC transporter substrate-binding protein [Dermatobacter hominis]|uniref:ABC transporter substrate-binding protein n=1 Tax=Dermatobacter hominis TaxID=2884263 RepID=UPI001D113C94|nr:ABC transporter substrate-binding protein [Dermatobacter hominis]UDY34625.1 ABC transporter substrate-binding protein [Dermatobacter hominis]
MPTSPIPTRTATPPAATPPAPGPSARRRATGRDRLALFVALLAALVLGAAACGGDDDSSGATTTAEESGAADRTSPVTVDHRYGATTVDAAPTRIVSLDTGWTDSLLAMGVTPAGYIADPSQPDGFPWRGDRLADATELTATSALPYEQIAALQPDLIVVGYLAQDEGDYDKLAAIAPTIASLGDSQVDKWQDQVEVAGRVLGDEETAEEVVAEVDGQVAEVATALPGLEGKTFSFANYVAGDAIYVLGDPDDGANVLFGQLGLVIPDEIQADADQGRVELSFEQIGMLDGDLLLALLNGTDPSAIAGWDELPAVRADSVVDMDYSLAVALNTPTPLSIPWALEQIRPQLDRIAAA